MPIFFNNNSGSLNPSWMPNTKAVHTMHQSWLIGFSDGASIENTLAFKYANTTMAFVR